VDLILNDPCDHNFGGPWTQEKLNIINKYMVSYMNALKNQPFSYIYIDAFAGSGERVEDTTKFSETDQLLFGPDEMDQKRKIYDGSAKISLELEKPFDEYWFIEKNQSRYEELCDLKNKYPDLKTRIHCIQGDANLLLTDILKRYQWKKERGILFLDPYGASLKYETLKEIAKCEAIDIWLLFPIGQGIIRMLANKPEKISIAWEERLNLVFGCNDWRKEFYSTEQKETLFEKFDFETKKADFETVTNFYKKQLKKIFCAVANGTMYFSNSKNVPLFALIFAMTNSSPKAQGLALKIVEHLLKPKGQT